METIEREQQQVSVRNKAKDIRNSVLALAVGLSAVVGAERLAHGEEDCVQRDSTFEVSVNVPGCIEDLTGIDLFETVVTD